ncbi:MAG: DUF4231 domain-containing protein [Desulfobulbus sp.]|nr:DUF4231 domain-containing protein [Desulfobulbus sp.]
MSALQVTSDDLPGLYQSADQASLNAQKSYFFGLRGYLCFLVLAAFVSYLYPNDAWGALASAALFLLTLGILVFLRVTKPDDTWYNGRAVAESVKTRSWRWMMRAEPYVNAAKLEIVSKEFLNDLKAILDQNKSLSHSLQSTDAVSDPISETMLRVRALDVSARLSIYVEQRIKNQSDWYWLKSRFNKRRSLQWFWVSVALHIVAIAMLLYRVKDQSVALPVEVIATAAGAALTWLQAKKHNELSSAYALTAHEIVLIKAESVLSHK